MSRDARIEWIEDFMSSVDATVKRILRVAAVHGLDRSPSWGLAYTKALVAGGSHHTSDSHQINSTEETDTK